MEAVKKRKTSAGNSVSCDADEPCVAGRTVLEEESVTDRCREDVDSVEECEESGSEPDSSSNLDSEMVRLWITHNKLLGFWFTPS